MRGDDAHLFDIVEAADRIADYISGTERSLFLAHNMMKAAVVREIEIIGEATHRVTSAFKDNNPGIPWKDLERLRNFYIHVYDRVNYERVWVTACNTIPPIAANIRRLLPADDPSVSSEGSCQSE
jgi:uncharacterized protein with HEPN domain